MEVRKVINDKGRSNGSQSVGPKKASDNQSVSHIVALLQKVSNIMGTANVSIVFITGPCVRSPFIGNILLSTITNEI